MLPIAHDPPSGKALDRIVATELAGFVRFGLNFMRLLVPTTFAAPRAVGIARPPDWTEQLRAVEAPSIGELLGNPDLLSRAKMWVREASTDSYDFAFPRLWYVRLDASAGASRLAVLPTRFTDLYTTMGKGQCPRTQRAPEEPAICLLCSQLLCAGSPCCKVSPGERLHATTESQIHSLLLAGQWCGCTYSPRSRVWRRLRNFLSPP